MEPSDKIYVAAIDQGTTSTRFVIFNKKAEIVILRQIEHKQIYPEPGWVEHDPIEIRDNTYQVIKDGMKKSGLTADQLAAVGITNQRETTVVWNPKTGEPYCNAIVWQDTRTDEVCKKLARDGDMDCFRKKVGLPLATYFSGPKISWLLDNVKGLAKRAERGEAVFGNMDTWLIWWLTGGKEGGVHVTDVTNASRTMLMNIETLKWDDDMTRAMGIPVTMLPQIRSSSEIYGHTVTDSVFGGRVPVAGDLGDQQAALFGQTCFEVGEAKSTYGTGCFLLLNTGQRIIQSEHGLLTTLGYKIAGQKAVYALEGSIAIAGSLVQWYRDNFGLISKSSEIEAMARAVPDSGGVYFVPAFSGLFAPYWDSRARGLIIGLTHYINRNHLARAILEATAFQVREIFDSMIKDADIDLKALKVDGGMVPNDLLMQFQADILGIPVIRPGINETTVLGAAYAAGLAVGFWESLDELKKNWIVDREWNPGMPEDKVSRLYKGWKKSVKRSIGWMD